MAMRLPTRGLDGITLAMGLFLLVGCTGTDHGTLTEHEYDSAVAAARQRLDASQDENLTAAYAVLQSSDAGSKSNGCPSRIIHVTLAGDFPNSSVLPAAGKSATITALTVDVDPATGRTCQTGAVTSPQPMAPDGSANLLPELD